MALTALLAAAAAVAAEPVKRRVYEQDGLRISFTPRTPEQMIAFYTGRRFPQSAMGPVSKACFITIGIRNRTGSVVWLEPARWRLTTADGQPVPRLDRAHWARQWEAVGLPQANRATFGWTLLPERRDLRPDEPVGGNLTIAPPAGEFTIEARFLLGPDQGGGERVVRMTGLVCPRDRPDADGGNGQ